MTITTACGDSILDGYGVWVNNLYPELSPILTSDPRCLFYGLLMIYVLLFLLSSVLISVLVLVQTPECPPRTSGNQ